MTTIVLAHGIARFDELLVLLGKKGLYFNGIADHLRAHGFPNVVETNVAFADSVDKRSEQLAGRIGEIAGPVHIIAHSMGGLDARHMILGHQDVAGRVKSLTTIGTPHNGTSFADFGIKNGGNKVVEAFRLANWPSIEGFGDLTTSACQAFNEKFRDKESESHVKYRVVSASESSATTFGPLKPSFRIIVDAGEGDNDGLVSVASQQWTGNRLRKPVPITPFPVPADHLNEVGWWDPAELKSLSPVRMVPNLYMARIKDFYLELVRLAVSNE